MQQGGTPDFVSGLATEGFVLKVSGASGVRIHEHFKPTDESFANGRREAHVCVEPHDENRLNLICAEPVFEARSAESSEDVLLEEGLGSVSRHRPQAGRERRAPRLGDKRSGFSRLVVVLDPSNRRRSARAEATCSRMAASALAWLGTGRRPVGENSFWASTTITASFIRNSFSCPTGPNARL